MAAILTADSGKTEMQVSTVQIFKDHCHDISSPIAVPGFIHIIPDPLQLFKVIFDTLIICTCLRIARLINIIIVCCRLCHGEIEENDKSVVTFGFKIKV
ncbi:MAG: hypothetical protein A2277_20650 [Desulfobacterales bacterium RIFOXYA12_FULL_46_15]|nr:MAG: hypothetical protein A2277_20650 [Desulfobacterales bacterium RIFOXYA12_FULL_46_15]